MSHPAQVVWCRAATVLFAEHFGPAAIAVDFGSLDINGNNRVLFHEDADYTGVDLGPGPNVDVVSKCHEWQPPKGYVDTVVSTEMLEHDEHWEKSWQHMVRILAPRGLLVFTCATEGRPEHGTHLHAPGTSPFTNGYYRNLTEDDFVRAIGGSLWLANAFQLCRFDVLGDDLRFWGIKR